MKRRRLLNILENIDFGEGIIMKTGGPDFDLTEETTFEEIVKLRDEYSIDEEILYVVYDNGLGLDIGIYGSHGRRFLCVSVFRGCNTETPPFSICFRNISRLVPLIEKAVKKIQEMRLKDGKEV